MHIDLSGRVAVVTGAGRGIGRALVRRLAAEGVTTVALDVHPDELDALGAELGSESGVPASQFVCDVTDLARIQEVVEETVRRHGRIDILVNNAGIVAGGPVDVLSEESWRRCQDVNLTGTFLMCKAVVPVMKEQRSGRIINVSSFAAIVPTAGGSAYASAKAAVAHFTRALAGELGPWNITANAYAPGMVPTQMNHFAERSPEEQDRLLDLLTIRRWGTPDDIANLVCFLASDQAGYVTGTLIDVSGGKLATQMPRAAYDRAAHAT
ncbi:SDR family NAD(P)-dependent oxidoreductase [Actinopolymorpha singaporensis]|uniref:3-oxoacyl-[acyl-carrier protein] reductase n=1 Tax=Actinopolymorpha singaporensis TaxID=117157 RepID=A0A1H1RX47_9ACTN|nr:SDR family NAD(P)-dependent oxidoreductase [Actinopolymorpha singaporensis]SDS39559.1 3-oxoacyl-[acyl-carrier protein] reductase [Actinopolymorpha singaporensis]